MDRTSDRLTRDLVSSVHDDDHTWQQRQQDLLVIIAEALIDIIKYHEAQLL